MKMLIEAYLLSYKQFKFVLVKTRQKLNEKVYDSNKIASLISVPFYLILI